MDLNLDQDQLNEKEVRPTFLVVLCVLSFVSIGMSLLSSVFQTFNGPLTKAEMTTQNVQMTKLIPQMKTAQLDSMVDFIEKMILMTESLNRSFYAGLFVTLLTLVIGLLGVIKMWKGVKLGFHLYIVYSLLSSAHVYLFVNPAYVPAMIVYFNLILSILFIFMYSRNLKWMK